jgi:hypothetical protein
LDHQHQLLRASARFLAVRAGTFLYVDLVLTTTFFGLSFVCKKPSLAGSDVITTTLIVLFLQEKNSFHDAPSHAVDRVFNMNVTSGATSTGEICVQVKNFEATLEIQFGAQMFTSHVKHSFLVSFWTACTSPTAI